MAWFEWLFVVVVGVVTFWKPRSVVAEDTCETGAGGDGTDDEDDPELLYSVWA
jgi:hypothetical protein